MAGYLAPMPLLAALWLALLPLLAAPLPARGAVERASIRADLASPAAARRDDARRDDDVLRAPRPLPALGALRASAPRPPVPPAHGAAPTPWPRATVATVAEWWAARQPSHAPAARGGVLPYYPTAPPIRG